MGRNPGLYLLAFALVLVLLGLGNTTGAVDSGDEFEASAVEAAAVERINEARNKNNVRDLKHSERLQNRSREWSETIAKDGEMRHGYIGCEPGGENILYVYWEEEFETDRGEKYLDSSEEVGREIANSWLNSSSGHRENILNPRFRVTAVGVYRVTDDMGRERVYATQRLCG